MLPGEPPNASFILTNETMKAMIPWDKRNNKLSSCEYLDGNETKSCEGYIFDHSVYGHTAVIEVNRQGKIINQAIVCLTYIMNC